MKRSKLTGEQIAFALRQTEVGAPIAEVCRTMGVLETTFYRWKQLYGDLGPSELRKMRELEEENHRRKSGWGRSSSRERSITAPISTG